MFTTIVDEMQEVHDDEVACLWCVIMLLLAIVHSGIHTGINKALTRVLILREIVVDSCFSESLPSFGRLGKRD